MKTPPALARPMLPARGLLPALLLVASILPAGVHASGGCWSGGDGVAAGPVYAGTTTIGCESDEDGTRASSEREDFGVRVGGLAHAERTTYQSNSTSEWGIACGYASERVGARVATVSVAAIEEEGRCRVEHPEGEERGSGAAIVASEDATRQEVGYRRQQASSHGEGGATLHEKESRSVGASSAILPLGEIRLSHESETAYGARTCVVRAQAGPVGASTVMDGARACEAYDATAPLVP